MTPAGSSRVTPEKCPRCGGQAAVGWRPVVPADTSWPVVEYAVEFDCENGCGLSVEEMVWSFNSPVTRQPSAGEDAGPGDTEQPLEAETYRPAGVPADSPPDGGSARRIEALELIPGHPNTAAEVWLWHGRVPELAEEPRCWISLRTDDWPMCPATARGLASALLAAAAIAEA
jgi:hypothetical protein